MKVSLAKHTISILLGYNGLAKNVFSHDSLCFGCQFAHFYSMKERICQLTLLDGLSSSFFFQKMFLTFLVFYVNF